MTFWLNNHDNVISDVDLHHRLIEGQSIESGTDPGFEKEGGAGGEFLGIFGPI